ncbi:MAG TPA: hypothetical protein VLD65_02890 [Anaerolineales bacterium]|nr:hypothetical protein [Anaerolineales bacterium]
MRKLAVVLIILLLIVLAACANTAGSSEAHLIEPGDKIGDFIITTGVQGNFTYGFEVQRSELSQNNTYSCNSAVGEAVNVSTGLYNTTGNGTLDTVRANSK